MVVLAVSVITKSGKPLVSRQFVDMTRIRIEGLLAAFPKLVGSGKQHTYVETENVRYVYQPMDTLYVLLVTNKQSNILEDLDTLRLISKAVPDYCPQLDEESISKMAFELIFAFDEVISVGGHKEPINLQQVKQYTEMESHEEKLHKMILASKIQDTKDQMRKKATEIDKQKMEKMKMEGPQRAAFGGGGLGGQFISEPNGRGGAFGPVSSPYKPVEDATQRVAAPAPAKGKGMTLGKSNKNQLLESLKAEGEVINEEPAMPLAGPMRAAAPPTDPITVSVEERLVCVLRKDGGVENLEVQGTMALEIQKEEDAYIRVQVESGANKNVQFKTHPNIDKGLHQSQNVLGLKDPNRPFPTGSPLGILKWRFQSKEEGLVPLNVNCWPSVSGSESFVNIEYEASQQFDLQRVLITIPLPALRDPPAVNQVDGDWRYDTRRAVLEWQIDLIDNSNRNGSMEFVVPASDPGAFFPIDVKFTAETTFCDARVKSVAKTSGELVKWGGRTQLVVDSYQVI